MVGDWLTFWANGVVAHSGVIAGWGSDLVTQPGAIVGWDNDVTAWSGGLEYGSSVLFAFPGIAGGGNHVSMGITDWLPLLLAVPVLAMILGDFRHREVGLGWMAAFMAGAVAVAVWRLGVRVAALNMAGNILLLLWMAGGVMLYLRVTRGRWINPLKDYIGEGDLLFILGLTPLMGLKAFLVLLLAGLVVSLLWWAAVRIFSKRNATVPLVGTMGAVFCVWLFCSAWMG